MMASENGEVFIKSLAQFVRTHEKALANALQLKRQRAHHATTTGAASGAVALTPPTSPITPAPHPSTGSVLASALGLSSLGLGSHSVKPAKLTLTPHHLFYLLSRFEELGVDVGSMNIRLESIHAEQSPANYVSFLSRPPSTRSRSDRDSIHSVSSVRSAMSSISFWSNWGNQSAHAQAKAEKAQMQLQTDLKYLYSAFTKIPCLRLSPDRRARLISGYEEFPFDSAVPLVAFKNVSVLEISDLDFRQFFGWDRMADQLRSLTLRRAYLDDPLDLLINVVLDDMDKRRRRSTKGSALAPSAWPTSPPGRHAELPRMNSTPSTPGGTLISSSSSPRSNLHMRREGRDDITMIDPRNKSASPSRPARIRSRTQHRHTRSGADKLKRSESGSSDSSHESLRRTSRDRSSSNLLSIKILPASKWRFLRHLSLADNGLTALAPPSLAPLSNTLQSLDLSSNLFAEVPDCLATLTALRSLNLSNCMISSLHSLTRFPLPAITALNLRANRLASIAGIERLLSLERLDVRANRMTDPTEIARLTGIPDIREIWVQENPFAKSHASYRVTIFNLFRATPGYTEDVVLDAAGPGYNERRHLRERVAESAPVPVVRPVAPTLNTVEITSTSPIRLVSTLPSHVVMIEDESPGAVAMATGDAAANATWRKKGPRQRVVDVAAEERPASKRHKTAGDVEPIRAVSSLPSSASAIQTEPPVAQAVSGSSKSSINYAVPSANRALHERNSEQPPSQAAATTLRPAALTDEELMPPDAPTAALVRELEGINLNGEAYRRKVEALKEEFGSGWLHLLTEQGWRQGTAPSNPQSPTSFLAAGLPAPAPSLISGAPTMG